MAKKPLPSRAQLRQILDYCPTTGKLHWRHRPTSMFAACGRLTAQQKAKAWNARNAGREAFTANDGRGYRQGQVFKYHTTAHRVIWAWLHDEWPEAIDHISGDKADNRQANLRAVNRSGNQRNLPTPRTNTSGMIGVRHRFRYGKLGRWEAMIADNGKQVHLGSFRCATAALVARKAAERRLGYHPNHGRARA